MMVDRVDVDLAVGPQGETTWQRRKGKRSARSRPLDVRSVASAVRAFLPSPEPGDTLLSEPARLATTVPTAQMLAMKLAAVRMEHDYDDCKILVRVLLEQNQGVVDTVWNLVAPYLPREKMADARETFDDILEEAES